MALPSSGQISISQIRTELGTSSGSLRTLSSLAGFSTPDRMSDFWGYSAGSTVAMEFSKMPGGGQIMTLYYNGTSIFRTTNGTSGPFTLSPAAQLVSAQVTNSSATPGVELILYINNAYIGSMYGDTSAVYDVTTSSGNAYRFLGITGVY